MEPRPAEASDRAAALQTYLCARTSGLDLPEAPKELLRQLRGHLMNASDAGHLAMKPHEILRELKQASSPFPEAADSVGIYGGEKDFKRTGLRPRFVRSDGAWFTFTITIRAAKGQSLELIAYDFELCYPQRLLLEGHGPRFVRFDLNPPWHENDPRGLRCHMHPGHDDLLVPAPLMSPLELLDLFVNGLRLPEAPRRA
jgi:hypothetical protein